MNKIRNVLICGLGAIGSIYATKFSQNGVNLKILITPDRLEKYTKTPLDYNGQKFVFDYVLPDCEGFKADLIIVATKNNNFETACENLENFVGEDTIILSLLNGIVSEDVLAKKYGWDKVLYAYFVGHTSTRSDRYIDFDGQGDIVFGEKENSVLSERVLKVKAFLEENNVQYQLPKDMDYSRWKKFTVNVGANQTSVLLRANYEVIQKTPSALALCKNLMKEVQMIAKEEGIAGWEKILDDAVGVIYQMIPQGRTSMLQDVDNKRETEVKYFAGTVVELGRKHNIPTPYNKLALDIIEAIDDSLNAV